MLFYRLRKQASLAAAFEDKRNILLLLEMFDQLESKWKSNDKLAFSADRWTEMRDSIIEQLCISALIKELAITRDEASTIMVRPVKIPKLFKYENYKNEITQVITLRKTSESSDLNTNSQIIENRFLDITKFDDNKRIVNIKKVNDLLKFCLEDDFLDEFNNFLTQIESNVLPTVFLKAIAITNNATNSATAKTHEEKAQKKASKNAKSDAENPSKINKRKETPVTSENESVKIKKSKIKSTSSTASVSAAAADTEEDDADIAKRQKRERKQWSAEEVQCVKDGVAKHGAGSWKAIKDDRDYADVLTNRSTVDIKDKYRNLVKYQRV